MADRSAGSLAAALTLGAGLFLHACGGSGSGPSGTYASVDDASLTMELSSGGKILMTAAGVGSSQGTYTVDGEKVIVTVSGQAHTLILNGNCLEDPQSVFGKMCKGGKAGAASNVSTRAVPASPAGTWTASNADGQFKLEFGAGNTVTLTATPQSGAADTRSGTYLVLGDVVQITLAQGEPLTLKFVNNAYESTSFGLMMRFTRQ
jgi:hypothetical protein